MCLPSWRWNMRRSSGRIATRVTSTRTGAEKADPGDYLRGDARGIGSAAEKRLEADRREQACPDAHQRHRADPRRVPVVLTLGADRDGEDEGDDDAKGEIQIAAERQRR